MFFCARAPPFKFKSILVFELWLSAAAMSNHARMKFRWQNEAAAVGMLNQLKAIVPGRELQLELELIGAPPMPRSQQSPPPDSLGLSTITLIIVDPLLEKIKFPDVCGAVIAPQGILQLYSRCFVH